MKTNHITVIDDIQYPFEFIATQVFFVELIFRNDMTISAALKFAELLTEHYFENDNDNMCEIIETLEDILSEQNPGGIFKYQDEHVSYIMELFKDED